MPAAVETTPQEKVSLLGGPRREECQVLQSITCADWWALDTTVSGRLHVLLLAYVQPVARSQPGACSCIGRVLPNERTSMPHTQLGSAHTACFLVSRLLVREAVCLRLCRYRLELVAATSCAICGVSCVAWLTLAK